MADMEDDLVLHGFVRDSSVSRGARVEVSATGTDFYGAAGGLLLHVDPPALGDTPWLCGGCESCDGEGHYREAAAELRPTPPS